MIIKHTLTVIIINIIVWGIILLCPINIEGEENKMYYEGNYWLSQSEMETNATYVYSYLKNKGWSINAICAMLGNFQSESHINPSIWQGLNEGDTENGYGLAQWTPSTKYLNWCSDNGYSSTSMNVALDRLDYEISNNLQWGNTSTYPLSFLEFKSSTQSVGYLTYAFLYNYERPLSLEQSWRITQAESWYSYLTGNTPEPEPEPEPTPIDIYLPSVGDTVKVTKVFKKSNFFLSSFMNLTQQEFLVDYAIGEIAIISNENNSYKINRKLLEKI